MAIHRWTCCSFSLILTGLLTGCFNPNYDQGGFACATGKCPAGYLCVSEGTSKVCRKGGTSADLYLTDGRSPDVPRRDGMPGDTSSPDQSCPDADQDTVCDTDDICPGENDLIDIDVNSTKDCKENLLKNGQLASDISSWTASGNSQVVWDDTKDADGSEYSGSARCINTSSSPTMGTITGPIQCVQVNPATSYHLHGMLFIPQQAQQVHGEFTISPYENTDCTHTDTNQVPSSAVIKTIGSWTKVSHTFTTPDTTHSISVRLSVGKLANTGPMAIYYDNILLRK